MQSNNSLEAQVSQLQSHIAAQRWKEALGVADAILLQRPNDFKMHHNRGVLLQRLGRPEEAQRAFQESLRLNPDYDKAKSALTSVRSQIGKKHEPTPPSSGAGAAARQAAEDGVPEVWQPGDMILDLYEVTGVLGEGGMGRVYKVYHRGWNVDLAVKSPRPEILSRRGVVENFVTECETWVNLGLHPHTVSCYYVRTLGGTPRVFAEYVEGGSLSDWIHDGKLYEGGHEQALQRILDIAIQFAWGLHYAHEQGLVHQDVKPLNVMMTLDGTAKVTDFGLAKARAMAGETETAGTAQSILVSRGGMTPGYASPEQSAGNPLSRKTDIWSWAVSVLEMFTGEVTWMAGVVAGDALEAFLQEGPEDQRLPQLPGGLADLLRRCFQFDPSARPKDMLEIAEGLQGVYQQVAGRDYLREQPEPAESLADSLNNRAASLYDLGQRDRAESLLREALQTDANSAEANVNLALLTRDAALARHAVAHAPGLPWARAYLARLETGYEAMEARQEALRLFPENPDVQQVLTQEVLPMRLARMSSENVKWLQRAAKLSRQRATAEARGEWGRVAELTRQLLQMPMHHASPQHVTELRAAAARGGEPMLQEGPPWGDGEAAVSDRSRRGVGIGVDFSQPWIHVGIPQQAGGDPRVQVLSLPAFAFVTTDGRLDAAESMEQIRDWAVALMEAGIPLEHRLVGGLEVFEAERPVNGALAVLTGARSSINRPEVECCYLAGRPFSGLDVVGCLLAGARGQAASAMGISVSGVGGCVMANTVAGSYKRAMVWRRLAECAGFDWIRIVSGPGVTCLALALAGPPEEDVTYLVAQLDADEWTHSVVTYGDGVCDVMMTARREDYPPEPDSGQADSSEGGGQGRVSALDHAVQTVVGHFLSDAARSAAPPAAAALCRLDVLTDAQLWGSQGDRDHPRDSLRTRMYGDGNPGELAALVSEAFRAWLSEDSGELLAHAFAPKESWCGGNRKHPLKFDRVILVGPLAQAAASALGVGRGNSLILGLGPDLPVDERFLPATALAQGLGVQAGILMGLLTHWLLMDVTPYSLSIADGGYAPDPATDAAPAPDDAESSGDGQSMCDETPRQSGRRVTDEEPPEVDLPRLVADLDEVFASPTALLTRDTTLPTLKHVGFTTMDDDQERAWVRIADVDPELALLRGSLFYGCFEAKKWDPLLDTLFCFAPAPAGVARIDVSIDIDANGTAQVMIRDLGTGHEKTFMLSEMAVQLVVGSEWRAKGKAHAERGELWAAERAFELAVEKGPLDVETWADRTRTLLSLRRYSEAVFCARKAYDLKPVSYKYAKLVRDCEERLAAEMLAVITPGDAQGSAFRAAGGLVAAQPLGAVPGITGRIRLGELHNCLDDLCNRIDRKGETWEIDPDGHGEPFVLGPESVCGKVLGLYDQEYGWPDPLDVEGLREVEKTAPGPHRHPFLMREGRCIAIAVSRREFDDIVASWRRTDTQ